MVFQGYLRSLRHYVKQQRKLFSKRPSYKLVYETLKTKKRGRWVNYPSYFNRFLSPFDKSNDELRPKFVIYFKTALLHNPNAQQHMASL